MQPSDIMRLAEGIEIVIKRHRINTYQVWVGDVGRPPIEAVEIGEIEVIAHDTYSYESAIARPEDAHEPTSGYGVTFGEAVGHIVTIWLDR